MKHRLRPWLWGIAALLLLEGLCRVYVAVDLGPYGTSVSVQGNSRWEDDAVAGWRNRPRYLEFDRSAQYNERGLRVPAGHVAMPHKEPGELWVLLLGGSVMAGVGSAQTGEWLSLTGISTHPITDAIDGRLEAILRARLPGRRVRVFNGATAWYTLRQSRQLYRRLRDIQPDWVVSLDGVNEPETLGPSQTTADIVADRWRKHPVNRFPMRQARFAMSRSAVTFLLGETLFFRTGLVRVPRNREQDREALARWRGVDKPFRHRDESPGTERAVSEFLRELIEFDEELTGAGQRHLLLIQPELSLRSASQLGPTERALRNYYASLNGGFDHVFLRAVHDRVREQLGGRDDVQSLASFHERPGWVFLDNCHLTSEANGWIAEVVADRITAAR